jgi:KDO2-lipid IV(A) lauroyltransferase
MSSSRTPSAKWWHRPAGWSFRVVIAIVRGLPAPLVYGVADTLALVLLAWTKQHERRIARKGRGLERNLGIVFREGLSPAMRRRLMASWARHMTALVVDFLRMPAITRSNVRHRVDVSELEALRPLVERHRGLICASGHMGVFELPGHVASLLGFPVTFVARPIPIPELDQAVRALRSSGGQEVLSKWGVLWPLKKALDRGRAVGIACDENVREKAVFSPFLGTIAATSPTVHRATGAPVAVVSCQRVGRGRYAVRVWDVIREQRTADKQADVQRITDRISAGLSRAILDRPGQWFWGSRRFQTRPPGELPGADGLPPVAVGPTAAAGGPTTARERAEVALAS